MKFFQDDKKISRRKAEEICGKERLNEMVKDAKATFMEDPLLEASWYMGSNGMIRIEIL